MFQAVAQLDVSYGVDYEPFKDQSPYDCFNLTINEYFRGRNKSEIDVKSCFRCHSLTVRGNKKICKNAIFIQNLEEKKGRSRLCALSTDFFRIDSYDFIDN